MYNSQRNSLAENASYGSEDEKKTILKKLSFFMSLISTLFY